MKGNNVAISRLTKEHNTLLKNPVDNLFTIPDPDNLFVWHFVIYGLKDCPYAGGYYHGKLIFPKDYPFKPPHLQFVTPSGRFITNQDICLSITNYHPESWSVAWRIETILVGAISFMNSREETGGSIRETDEARKKFAQASLEFNLNNQEFMRIFGNSFDKFGFTDEKTESKEKMTIKKTDNDETRDNKEVDMSKEKKEIPAVEPVVLITKDKLDLTLKAAKEKYLRSKKDSTRRKKVLFTVVALGLVGAYAFYRSHISTKRRFGFHK